MAHDFVEKDTDSKLEVTCKNQDGSAIILTGSTVKLYWKTTSDTRVKSAVMTVTDAAGGVAEYTFTVDGDNYDLTHGGLEVEIEITDSSGNVVTSMTKLKYSVRRRLNSGAG